MQERSIVLKRDVRGRVRTPLAAMRITAEFVEDGEVRERLAPEQLFPSHGITPELF